LGSAERSSLRALMPSLPNPFRGGHSTVRGAEEQLRPDLGLVRPSAARCAICSSCV
jgi:hypothetical protein